jgi:Fe-S cluster assembly iron-binding protein IscA
MELEVTPAAQEMIQQFLEEKGLAEAPLRLLARRTHCMGGRGHTYDLDAPGEVRQDDLVLAVSDLCILVDPQSQGLFGDVRIAHGAGATGGLQVINSLAVGKCPCGHHDLLD